MGSIQLKLSDANQLIGLLRLLAVQVHVFDSRVNRSLCQQRIDLIDFEINISRIYLVRMSVNFDRIRSLCDSPIYRDWGHLRGFGVPLRPWGREF